MDRRLWALAFRFAKRRVHSPRRRMRAGLLDVFHAGRRRGFLPLAGGIGRRFRLLFRKAIWLLRRPPRRGGGAGRASSSTITPCFSRIFNTSSRLGYTVGDSTSNCLPSWRSSWSLIASSCSKVTMILLSRQKPSVWMHFLGNGPRRRPSEWPAPPNGKSHRIRRHGALRNLPLPTFPAPWRGKAYSC